MAPGGLPLLGNQAVDFIVIGTGSAGERITRDLLSFHQEVVAVADPKLENQPQKHQYQDPLDCLRKEAEGRTVVIASPHKFHAQQALLAIDCGAHALLIEKPLAMKAEDAEAVWRGVNALGIKAGVYYNYRFHDALKTIMATIPMNQPPGILVVSACEDPQEWPSWGPNSYLKDPENGGILFAAMTHCIDFGIRLFGIVESVQAVIQGESEEQSVMLRTLHANGNNCMMISNWSDRKYWTLAYLDRHNSLTLDFYSKQLRGSMKTMHQDFLKQYLSYLSGDSIGEVCTVGQAYENVVIMNAAMQSSQTNTIVAVTRNEL